MIFQLSSPKIPKNLPRPLTDNQIKKFLDRIMKKKIILSKLRNKAFVILLWGCGLRISEALSLKTSDIKDEYIVILGKGKKERLIPIISQVKKVLSEWIWKGLK